MRLHRATLACVAAVLAAPVAAAAAPGDPDLSFGTRGSVLVADAFGNQSAGIPLIGLQRLADGRLVALGVERGANSPQEIIARYTANGALDASFGRPASPGVISFSTDTPDEESPVLDGVAVGADGGLALGFDRGPAGPVLDVTGPDGTLVRSTPVIRAFAPQAVLPDGRILATAGDRAVLFGPDLTPDPLFGDGPGVPIPGPPAHVVAMAASANALYVAGYDGSGFVLWRTPLDGAPATLDRVPFPLASTTTPIGSGDLVVGADGRALLRMEVGPLTPAGGVSDFRTVLAEFDRAGRANLRFGRSGLLFLSRPDARAALQADGKVVTVSSIQRAQGTRPQLIVRRFDRNGHADRTFRQRRLSTVALRFSGLAVVVDARGRILIGAGATTGALTAGLLLMRLKSR